MNFRFNHTGNANPILGLPYLEYETLFFHEHEKVWKKTKSRIYNCDFVHDIVAVDKTRKVILDRTDETLYNGLHYNFYEYKIDIDLLLKEPIKINSLRNFIMAEQTTDNYKNYQRRVAKIISKEDRLKIQKLDWFGRLNFQLELGILFPELFEKLFVLNEKKDLKETFRFIVFDVIKINDILKAEISQFNKIMNGKKSKKLHKLR